MNNLDRKVTRQVIFLLIFSYDYARMNKNCLNKEVIMEYKVHKCESAICQCFEVGRIFHYSLFIQANFIHPCIIITEYQQETYLSS